MDLERGAYVSRNQASAERLAEECARLAVRLCAGRWHLRSQRRVGIDRFVSEEIGGHEDGGPEPVEMMTRAAFSAHKYAGSDGEGNPYDEVQYDVRLTIGQSLTKEEIPANILDELFDDEDADGSGVDDDGPDDYDDPSILDSITRGDLDDLLLVREEEIGYRINMNGSIIGYDISHSYSFDDEVVYDMSYSSDESRPRSVPVYRDADGVIVDRRPQVVTVLTDGIIEREIREVDESLRLFIAEHSLRRTLELRGQAHRDHRQRALGILSIIGAGIAPVTADRHARSRARID